MTQILKTKDWSLPNLLKNYKEFKEDSNSMILKILIVCLDKSN